MGFHHPADRTPHPGHVGYGDKNRLVRAIPSPDDILLVVAGGIAGRFSACIPGWASMKACHSVIRALRDASCGT